MTFPSLPATAENFDENFARKLANLALTNAFNRLAAVACAEANAQMFESLASAPETSENMRGAHRDDAAAWTRAVELLSEQDEPLPHAPAVNNVCCNASQGTRHMAKHKFSKWYLAEKAAAARAASKPTRPCDRRPGGNTDAKAREYAHWLLRRDGVDLDALAANVRAEKTVSDRAEIEASVEWERCDAGLRPRFVQFELSDRLLRKPLPLARTELPNWSFEAEDLNADVAVAA